MSATDYYAAAFVESFPTPLLPGVLYVSTSFSSAGHICPCGCGDEIVTKLAPARYRVIFDGEISLSPSVAATGLRCNSHYFITRGRVDWHTKLNAKQVDRARVLDRQAVEQQRATPTGRRPSERWWRLRRST